jgi:hypothetical protein
MPRLLPGILELSRRARYFSFHAYLLDKYRELRMPADGKTLSAFIKAREWEYGLAVLNCPHHCGSSPVGAQSLRGIVGHHDPPYPRGQSVESAFGGYGLYYRSPLAEFGIVARAGTLLGDTPITVDVLYDTDRARRLAATFKDAVAATDYATTWMLTTDPCPSTSLSITPGSPACANSANTQPSATPSTTPCSAKTPTAQAGPLRLAPPSRLAGTARPGASRTSRSP